MPVFSGWVTKRTSPCQNTKSFNCIAKRNSRRHCTICFSLPESLCPMEKLLLTMSIRPDLLVVFVRQFVMETLGDAFVQQETLDIGKAFAETSAATPLIFIIGEEVDPCKFIFRSVLVVEKVFSLSQFEQTYDRGVEFTGREKVAEKAHYTIISIFPRMDNLRSIVNHGQYKRKF